MRSTSPQRIGVLYALSAYGFWGLVPIYFKAVSHISPLEVLAHRVIWSVPLTALLITLGKDWRELRKAIAKPNVLHTLFLSATLVSVNWLIFIVAISTDQVLQASMGYYINPLVNVLLGMIFLRERLRPLQIAAVLLAAAGTLNVTVNYGKLPWISLALAFSFGIYGLLRKTVKIESVNGLFVETTLISPLAFTYLLFLALRGKGAFGTAGWETTLLLFSAGAVTTFPLVWFTSAARRLPLYVMGLFQYIAPSCHFLLAVFLYREPFTWTFGITFGCIWAGLALFAVDSLRSQRSKSSTKDPH